MVDRFAGRSIHGAPKHAQRVGEHAILRMGGEVAKPLALHASDLAALDHVRFLEHEPPDGFGHWPRTDWSGVPIRALLALAEPRSDATWVQVLGGPLGTVMAFDDVDRALLCDRIGDEPIPIENGGPFRLVCADLPYNLCVKWVDRIVVSVDEPDRSVERVAAARQRARDARRTR